MGPGSRRVAGVLLVVGSIVVGVLPAVAHRHKVEHRADPVAEASARPLHTHNTLLVGLDGAPLRGALGSLPDRARANVHARSHIADIGVVRVRVPHDQLETIARRLEASDDVRFVEREGRALASATPNDPYFPWSGSGVLLGGQWGDGVTQAQKAWDVTTGSPSVTVAIVDSGIDAAHPDLAGKVVAGTSIVGGSTTDTDGHGEYVAGVVAPNTNNGVGVAGYCWSCKLMPVKITNGGSASYGDMASGIIWATDHGARVINVSYAGTSSSSTLNAAVSYATSRGAVVVAAAGNSGCNCPTYPAASPGAVAVAASDQRDGLETYSNWGPWVQVAAPTGDITTTLIFNGEPYTYAPTGGTSISAPVVAGILALMLSFDPTATPSQLKNALFSSVDPITGMTQSGASVSVEYGRVNAYKSLLALGAPAPSPDPSPSPTPGPSPSTSPSASSSPTSSSSTPPLTSSTTSTTSSSAPAPTGSSSGAPVPQTFTFSGSLNKQNPSRTFSVMVPAGAIDAQLSFKRSPSLRLALLDGESNVILEQTGPSVVRLDAHLTNSGTYTFRVTEGRCNFTLTVTTD